MKSCPNCEKSLDDHVSLCPDCGHTFETDATNLNRIIAGRFRVIAKLGEGGMGEVYRAEQMPINRPVALKLLRPSLVRDTRQVARFKREAQAITKLNHPNTVIIHDFGQDDDVLFIAMEELVGCSLAKIIKEEGALQPSRACRIMSQISASLVEAHGQGIIHRDLKPENIMLIERGGIKDFVKVLDFGIAKMLHVEDDDPQQEALTQMGAIFGTPQYMSPEQIKGQTVDARSDIYAMGLILYEMLAGHRPFKANTPMEMMTKHLIAQPDELACESEDPQEKQAFALLEKIVLKALAKDPNERQQSAQEMLDQLTAILPDPVMHMTTTSMHGVTLPAANSQSNEANKSGRKLMWIVFSALLIILAGLVVFLMLRPSEEGQIAEKDLEIQRMREGRQKAALKRQEEKQQAEAERKASERKVAQAEAERKAAEQKAAQAEAERKAAEQTAAQAKAALKALEEARNQQALETLKANQVKAAESQNDYLKAQEAIAQAQQREDLAKQKVQAAELKAQQAIEQQRAAELKAQQALEQLRATEQNNAHTPAPQPAPQTALPQILVRISTVSPNAKLEIDGKAQGGLPANVKLPIGKHTITVRTTKGSQFQIINLKEGDHFQTITFPL